ncbi:MAG: rhomboid family intramembrane serine protease [Deltaproteobacteria bacterium]|nr:rhomboid family intramembrane serine protease [Deltaproteobacteria bacterium]
MTQCRLRTEDGEEILSLDELEDRVRAGGVPSHAWVSVEGLTHGFVRLRDSPFAARWDPVARARFRAAFALDRWPVLSVVTALACVLIHARAEQLSDGVPDGDVLLALGARARAAVVGDGEAWRLWTGAFLHRDRIHLAFNAAVFVAVGGALESIYTRTGWLAVVATGMVSSSLLSLWLGPPVTVGLSGVVFAALGACVGFGARFREVLRWPYQHWFGVAALAYALFALWTGARVPDVDHAAHLGGLLGGLAAGLVLPPRRWRRPFETPWADPGLLAGAGLVMVAATGLVASHAWGPPREVTHTASQYGVVVRLPEGYVATRDAFGWAAYDNGLDAQVALACARADAAWPRWSGKRGPAEAMFQAELLREARAREIADFRSGVARPAVVGEAVGPSWPAQELPFAYHLPGYDVEARLVAFERGMVRCGLVLAARTRALARRGPGLDRVRATLHLVAPQPLVHARMAAHADPASLPLQLELGVQAVQAGVFDEAHRALGSAIALAADDTVPLARAHYAMATLGLLTLDGPLALRHAQRARDLVPQDVDVAVALYGAYRINGLADAAPARLLAEALRQVRPHVLRH